MRPQPPNFVQVDSPLRQHRIGNEFCESLVVDRLDFWDNECSRFGDFRHQILDLPDPREVFVVRAVLRQLKGCEVIQTFEFQIERLLKFQAISQILRRFAEFSLPLFE